MKFVVYSTKLFVSGVWIFHDLSGRSYFKHAQRRMHRGWRLGWSWGWLVGLSTPVLAWLGQRENHQVGFSLANVVVAGPEIGFSIGEDHASQQPEVASSAPTHWLQSLWWGVVVRREWYRYRVDPPPGPPRCTLPSCNRIPRRPRAGR